MKNPMGKGRKADAPYLTIVTNPDLPDAWTFKVLKAYSLDPEAPYARWFCVVVTPFTGPRGDMGDTYIREVVGTIVQRDPSVPDSALPGWLR